jgi:hypothetical protein
MHYKDAKGAGYAREIGMTMYNGENFYFQVDSHMRFVEGWDTKLIDMYDVAQDEAGTHKVILSQFPAPFILGSDGKDYKIHNDEKYWEIPSWTSVVNTWQGAWAGHRQIIPDLSKPYPTHTILAGLLFAHGDFVEEIPYDPRISFMGEELCIAVRAYTRGWKLYAPNEMVAWHHYKREEHPKVWQDNVGGRSWSDIEMQSQRIQKAVLTGEEDGPFGIGDREKYEEYQRMVGIDFAKFYENEIESRANLGVVHQEMKFTENGLTLLAVTGYCVKGLHSQCQEQDEVECKCICHGGQDE